MLTRLVIQDVVLIDKLTIDLAEGLNVLTGETGAGKSILLDSLSLALGARSDAGLIRTGADQASVTACFSSPLPTALSHLIADQGLSVEDPLILRRVLGRDGKSRAFVSDQPISIGLLRQIGETLLEVHGQFDTHGLLNASTHRGFLDSFGGLMRDAALTSAAFAAWQEARRTYNTAQQDAASAKAEEDFLRAATAELIDLAPQQGEIDHLSDKRKELQNFEKIVEALRTAHAALDGEQGAIVRLAQAGKSVARIADKADGLEALLGTIDRLSSEAEEMAEAVNAKLFALSDDPETLDTIEERLFALRAAARKHAIPPEELPALAAKFQTRLATLDDQSGQMAKLAKQVEKTKTSFMEKAEALSAKRQTAAKKLSLRVTKELPPLKFEKASFIVECTRLGQDQAGPDGIDRVTFLASTNPGTAAGALNKVASGGELSRFMLALKLVLTSADPVPSLVFDEVDAGIGGATAEAVGERLARLAKDVQILVVTHSPQVAARGHTHWRVAKETKGKSTRTSVTPLDHADRVEEIARMLSGATITDAARKAAQSLLKGA